MKNLLKFFALLLASASLTGCVATAQPGVVVAPVPAPYYTYPARPCYHRPYRPYYRPRPARVVVVEPRRRVVVPAPRPHYQARPYGRGR
ncbi:hypothetical protein DNI29_12825 [Hymenobacter sediminis]|uniref:hypothetical protein n=1 Tax=Hymenobacter sediminis TaxID=2218621 RepID=UPI000DA6B057|nr:hypothetical protein [Hymenobacter sediminis]RPD47034.1 hypothetical protein DNI29_12825 [Hymenobacter sediminis]